MPEIRKGRETTPRHSAGSPDHSCAPGRATHHFRTFGRVSRPIPDTREGHPTAPVHPGGSPDHSRTSGSASRPLSDNRDGLQTTPGHLGGSHDHFRTSERASRPLTALCKGLKPVPNIRESHPRTSGHPGGPQTSPGLLGGPPDHSRTSGRASRPLPDIREGLPTTP